MSPERFILIAGSIVMGLIGSAAAISALVFAEANNPRGIIMVIPVIGSILGECLILWFVTNL